MIEQNATIFVDETEEIRALMEGRGGRRSDKSTTTDDDDEWDETAGRNKPRVFRVRHQARLGSRSPPADRVPERDISKEEQEDIRRAIELSLQEMNPPVPSSLPQVHPEESPLPDTERLAPPVRRTRTESDDRPDSGARNRETGEIIAVENEPMAPRQTRHSRIDNGLGSDQRDHKDNVDEDKPVGRRKTRNSENNHPRVTVQETIGDSTRDNEPFGSGKTRSGNTESASATDGQTTRRNSAVARPAAGPVTYPVTRRPSNRCDKCVRLHRACPHNRSGQEGATHGNKHTGRKIGGNDELIQPGEELETHKQYTRSKGRDPVIDTRKTDKSSGSRMSGTVAAQSTEKKRARRNNQYSGGDTTESDEMTRPSKRKKTKKTVTEGAASRGKNQKAGEIPVLYPASQPPPKVTASRTEIRTEEFQKTLREEAGQVHHTFDPAKTNPLDRHTRSVTGRTPYSTDLPPRLGRSLADRVRSPPPVEQVQVTPARPTFSASGRTVTPLERSSVGGIQYRQQPAEPQVARAEINPEGIAMPWNQIERPVTESRMRNEAAEQVEQQTPRAGTSAQETEEGRDGIADYYSRIAEEDPFARFQ